MNDVWSSFSEVVVMLSEATQANRASVNKDGFCVDIAVPGAQKIVATANCVSEQGVRLNELPYEIGTDIVVDFGTLYGVRKARVMRREDKGVACRFALPLEARVVAALRRRLPQVQRTISPDTRSRFRELR